MVHMDWVLVLEYQLWAVLDLQMKMVLIDIVFCLSHNEGSSGTTSYEDCIEKMDHRCNYSYNCK